MSLILNIDTATEIAQVSISRDGIVLEYVFNPEPKDHAAFLHVAIKQLFENTSLQLSNLDAVATSAGPGSYTGLRVGMASAKGLCFALNKPLICLDSLELLARSAVLELGASQVMQGFYLCPMIDARRMEVFTAIYDQFLEPILTPTAIVLLADSFSKFLSGHHMLFFGSGSNKWKEICHHPQAIFRHFSNNSMAMSALSHEKYLSRKFAETAYCEPTYIKGFHS